MALSKQAREWFREQGAVGGRKAAQGLTKKQRSARAKKAVAAREAKRAEGKRKGGRA